MAAVRRLIREVKSDKVHGKLTLVPIANEPAFIRGERVAEDGLDLARTFPGRADGSITQRVAHSLSSLIRAADYFIDLHTGGTRLDLLPLAGYMLHRDPRVLERQRHMARAFNLPIIWGTSAELDGRSLSVARDADVPAIYAEYRGAAVCRTEGVEAYVSGCLNVMAALAMLDRTAPISAVETVVEDSRPQSGHLQICNPAPMDGFFEPAVKLGDRVQPGDMLGTVCDSLGRHNMTIQSQQAGIVLMLRSFPRVAAGDSVAVILEDVSHLPTGAP
jgi:predicted deacylase